MRREAHVRFLGGSLPRGRPLPGEISTLPFPVLLVHPFEPPFTRAVVSPCRPTPISAQSHRLSYILLRAVRAPRLGLRPASSGHRNETLPRPLRLGRVRPPPPLRADTRSRARVRCDRPHATNSVRLSKGYSPARRLRPSQGPRPGLTLTPIACAALSSRPSQIDEQAVHPSSLHSGKMRSLNIDLICVIIYEKGVTIRSCCPTPHSRAARPKGDACP